MLAYSLGAADNAGMQLVLLLAVIGLVWMNVPDEEGWTRKKRRRAWHIRLVREEEGEEDEDDGEALQPVRPKPSPRTRSRSRSPRRRR